MSFIFDGKPRAYDEGLYTYMTVQVRMVLYVFGWWIREQIRAIAVSNRYVLNYDSSVAQHTFSKDLSRILKILHFPNL